MPSNEIAKNSASKPLYRDQYFYLINILSVFGMFDQMMSPVRPMLADTFQVSAESIAYLTSIYALPVLFVSPILGILIDRFGRNKVLFISMLVYGITGMGTVWASSYEALCAIFFLRGISAPGLSIIASTLVGDVYPDKKRRAAVMGWKSSWSSIGNSIFPLVSSALIAFSWKAPFLVFGIVIPFAFWALLMKEPVETKKVNGSIKDYWKQTGSGMKNPQFWIISIASFSIYFMLSGIFTSYVPFFVRNSFGGRYIGIVMSIMGITSTISSLLYGYFVKLVKSESLICKVSFLIMGAGFAVGSFSSSIFMTYIFSGIFGFGLGLVMPGNISLLMPIATDQNRGSLVAANNMIKRAGQVVGPIVWGFVFDAYGVSVLFGAGAIYGVLIFLYSMFMLHDKQN